VSRQHSTLCLDVKSHGRVPAVLNAIESRSNLSRVGIRGDGEAVCRAESDLPHGVDFVTARHGMRPVLLVSGLGP
jgi:hypothetical protein